MLIKIFLTKVPIPVLMKRLPSNEKQLSDTIVQRIWEEIVFSMDQYTNDSQVPKFYLPESLLSHCRTAAAIFTQLLYAPIPSTKVARKTRLYSLFYLTMAYGVQAYLKERSIIKNYAPYQITDNPETIRHVRNKIGRMLSEGIRVKSPVSQVMDIFLIELNPHKYIRQLSLKGREFNAEKLDNLLPAAIMWGYLTAEELIIDTRE